MGWVVKDKAVKGTTKQAAPKPMSKISKVFTKAELYGNIAERASLTRKQVAAVFDGLNEIISLHLKKMALRSLYYLG